ALAAALLSERDPFTRSPDQPRDARHMTRSDVLDRVEALEQFERDKRLSSSLGTLHRNAAHFVLRARDQLLRSLRQEKPSRVRSSVPHSEFRAPSSDDEVLRALLTAFPDRVARRREAGG